MKFYERGSRPLEIVTSRQWYIRNGGRDAGPPRGVPRPRQGARLVPRPHAPPLRPLGRGAQRRLADQPPALLRRADPAVVPARRRRRGRPRPPDRPGRGHAADRPVVRRAARLHRRPARPARRLRRRPGHHGHVGDVVADAADRRPLGRRPRPVRAGVPDGHPPAGPRHHPHLAVLDRRARRTTSTARCRGPTRRSTAGSSTPTARRCRSRRATSSRRCAPVRAVRHRRRPLLVARGPARRRHRVQRGAR